MLAAKGRYYRKLHDKVLKIDILSSTPILNAKLLKQQDEKLYLRQIEEIKDYLSSQINKGDGVAWALYYVAHEEKLKQIPELSDRNRIKDFLETHTDRPNSDDIKYFSPQAIYYAEVLGLEKGIEEHKGFP
ncbi:hypothetical protein [Candidatus Phycorickettsia trachydisci]|nr:hypothetical protein [Candidatus Phycorickettsia trachydisci]